MQRRALAAPFQMERLPLYLCERSRAEAEATGGWQRTVRVALPGWVGTHPERETAIKHSTGVGPSQIVLR